MEFTHSVSHYYVSGYTPLHLAAQASQAVTAQALIAKGADLNAKDVAGKAVSDKLRWFVRKDNRNIVYFGAVNTDISYTFLLV